MDGYLLLTTKLLISTAVSMVALRMLSHPLSNVLRTICPNADAATFWLSYTKVMLTIGPALLVLLVDWLAHFSHPLDSLRLTLIAALCGLILGMLSIGKRLGAFVVTPSHREPAP